MQLSGFDPYDALRGRHLPRFVCNHRVLRRVAIQLRKRVPVNLAPMYGVRPFVMAKAVACFLSAHSRRSYSRGITGDDRRQAAMLVDTLLESDGCLGDGAWGYEFDVQTRWAYYAAGSPNLIATVFAGHALLEAGMVFGQEAWTGLGVDAALFSLRELHLESAKHGGPLFRYTMDSDRLIHNANLLGASLLAAASRIRPALAARAISAARTSVRAQDESGRWAYGEGASLGWADNFHTAYNLGALLHLRRCTSEFDPSIARGARFWTHNFFGADGAPRYYDHTAMPYDVHSGATAVEVAIRLRLAGFEDAGVAERCADWMRANLVSADGTTWYQKWGRFTDRRRFVRWGDAHWDLAVATEALNREGCVYAPWSDQL